MTDRAVHALNLHKTRGYSVGMMSHRMLTSFIIFFWCGTSTLAQLSKTSERCLSNVMLGQEIRDTRYLPQTAFVRIARVDFGENSSIPGGLQREIKARVERERYEEGPEPDYLQSAGDEIANNTAELLKERGYFGATAKAKVTELEKVGKDVTAVASISSEAGLQYRLGALTVVPADSDKSLALMTQALRSEFRLQPNEILNVAEIKNGLSRLTKIYCEFGFIDITTEPEFKIDDAKRTIDVSILVHEGRQYYVNDVEFRGVDPKLEARLRSKLPRRSWLFNSDVLKNFFKANRSVLPMDASPEDDAEFHRDTKGATVTLLFDFRPRLNQTSVRPTQGNP